MFLACFLWAQAGCGGRPLQPTEALHTPPILQSPEDLLDQLSKAGWQVARSGPAPPIFGQHRGERWQLGEQSLWVYPFAEVEDAESAALQMEEVGPPASLGGGLELRVWNRGKLVVLYSGEDGGLTLLLNGLFGDWRSAERPAVDEPYPPAITSAITWIAAREDQDPQGVEVVGFEPAEWDDECLGLPEPGEVCPASPVEGWIVMLRFDESQVTVRTDALGDRIRVEPPGEEGDP